MTPVDRPSKGDIDNGGEPDIVLRYLNDMRRIAGGDTVLLGRIDQTERKRRAEMAASPAEPSTAAPDVRNLVCPYCGGKLRVHTQTTGPAYLSYEEPESIECVVPGCSADWEPDGTLRTAAGWVLHPTLYSRPEPGAPS